MTMNSRPRVLTESDAGTMDTLLKRTDTAATQAEARVKELGTAIAAVPGQVTAATAPAVAAAQQAAALAVQRSGVLGSLASEADLTGKQAGDWRIGLQLVSWSGSAVTARTPILEAAGTADIAAVQTPTGVANEAALSGKPAGQYLLASTGERVAWSGNAVTARGPDQATAPQLDDVRRSTQYATPTALSADAVRSGETRRITSEGSYLYHAPGALPDTLPPLGTLILGASDGGQWRLELGDDPILARHVRLPGDGVTDLSGRMQTAVDYALALKKGLHFPRTADYYNFGQHTLIDVSGDYLSITFDPDARIINTGNGDDAILDIHNPRTGLGVEGGIWSYQNPPATRNNKCPAAIVAVGPDMSYLTFRDMTILNSPNFGLLVKSTSAAGSHDATIQNVRAINTGGDGVHVENFDRNVVFEGITGENNGDDVCALTVDRTVRVDPTYNVRMDGIIGINPRAATCRMSGVDGGQINNVISRGGDHSTDDACAAIGLSAGSVYLTPNRNIMITNVLADNIEQAIQAHALDEGSENSNIVARNIRGTRLRSSGLAAHGRGRNISISLEDFEFTARDGNTARPIDVQNGGEIEIGKGKIRGYVARAHVNGCARVEARWLRYLNPLAAVGDDAAYGLYDNGLVIVEGLEASDASGQNRLDKGIEVVNNARVIGYGGCRVSGNRRAAAILSNASAEGYLDELLGVQVIGDVQIGTATTLTWSRPVLGAQAHVQVTVSSNDPFKHGTRNLGLTDGQVVWGEGMSGVAAAYTVRGLMG